MPQRPPPIPLEAELAALCPALLQSPTSKASTSLWLGHQACPLATTGEQKALIPQGKLPWILPGVGGGYSCLQSDWEERDPCPGGALLISWATGWLKESALPSLSLRSQPGLNPALLLSQERVHHCCRGWEPGGPGPVCESCSGFTKTLECAGCSPSSVDGLFPGAVPIGSLSGEEAVGLGGASPLGPGPVHSDLF